MPRRPPLGQLGRGDGRRDDLGEDVGLPHPAGDQPRVLRAEVDDEDLVVDRGQWPMPTPWDRWSCLPSVCRDGATMTSAFWNSFSGLVPAGGHRGAQRTEEVHPAVVLVRRAEQDLAAASPRTPVRTRAPRGSVGWNVAMPQWKPRAGASTAEDERRAEHDRVGAAGDRLGDVAALAHAAVGDHVHVDPGLVEVAHPRRRPHRRWPSPGARRCRARPGWCRRCPDRRRRAPRPRRCA